MKKLLFLLLISPTFSFADTQPFVPADAYDQNNLGWMYERGRGVEKNLTEAFHLFKESADQGNPYGQMNLGLMYENGTGVQQDMQQAINWYHLAAAQGSEPAIAALQRLGIK
jgi:hypothetical protein